MNGPSILVYDLETCPHLGYFWDLWNQNIAPTQVKEFSRVLCFAAKWLDEEPVMFFAEWDKGGHRQMVRELHKLFDKADILVAHNGDKFDKKRSHAEFIKYKLKPPSPSRSVDTLKAAKNAFKFASNRLDHIGQYLEAGRKIENAGFKLWLDVLDRSVDAQQEMMEYNIQDVRLLESVYKEFRPWISNHPNWGVYTHDDEACCAVCGSYNLQRRGYAPTQTQVYQRWQCMDCGKWSRTRLTEQSRAKSKTLLTSDTSK